MNSHRKTGVLTFHRCINYGSYWQVRCLVEELQARGHTAIVLDYDSWRANFAEWKCALQPVLPMPVPKTDRPLYRMKMLKFFCAFDELPCSPRFALEEPTEMECYDTVVVGSDEVWNLRHPWYGGKTLFYGTGVKARRLVSYAASFGNQNAHEGLEPAWAERLRAFHAISVRDNNSRTMIRNALGFEPNLVLDPCLQRGPQPEGQWRGPQQPFVAVYGHNFSPGFSQQVRCWAQARGYQLVSIGYRNDWADRQWLTAGPHDFAHFMARAAAVVTNFFHGCVFALHNAKPFVCETSAYRSNKIHDLMAAVGGEKHCVSGSSPVEAYHACLSEPLEDHIHERLETLRYLSATYLDNALS